MNFQKNQTYSKINGVLILFFFCSKNLTVNEKSLDVIDNELQNTTRRVQSGNNRIAGLKRRVEDLKMLAQELRDNATRVLIENVEGKS